VLLGIYFTFLFFFFSGWLNNGYLIIYQYIKYIIFFVIMIPITFNATELSLLKWAEIKGNLSLPFPEKTSKYSSDLIRISKDKILSNFYKQEHKRQIIFYFILLILVILFY
jgi:hypothetical protein